MGFLANPANRTVETSSKTHGLLRAPSPCFYILYILDQSWKAILIFLFFAKNSLFQNVAFPSLQVNKVSLLIQMIMIDTILMNCKCIICPEHLPLSSGSVLTILEATPLFSGSALESPCERAEAVQLLIPLCARPRSGSQDLSVKKSMW